MRNCKLGAFTTLFFGIGVICLYLFFYPANHNKISAWLLYSLLSLPQLLTLIGFGFAISLASKKVASIAIATFLVGFFIGVMNYANIWFYFAIDSSRDLYLSTPLLSLIVGILLILPHFKWLLPVVSSVVGVIFSVHVKLTDITFHNPLILQIALLVSLWVFISVFLHTKCFYRPWFRIPMRIFGSWLIASGLLYGSTAFMAKKSLQDFEQIPDVEFTPDFTK